MQQGSTKAGHGSLRRFGTAAELSERNAANLLRKISRAVRYQDDRFFRGAPVIREEPCQRLQFQIYMLDRAHGKRTVDLAGGKNRDFLHAAFQPGRMCKKRRKLP